MKHRRVPRGFLRGPHAPIVYLDFREGLGSGQGALITGSAGTGGTATGPDGLTITDQQFTIALNLIPNFNPLRGTLFVEARPNAAGTFSRAASLNTDATEEIYIGVSSSSIRGFVVDGGVNQASYTLSTWGTASKKVAIAWENNLINMAADGVPGAADTTATLPTVVNLDIGHVRGSGIFPGTITRIALWNTNFRSDILQNLTLP